MNWIIPTYTGKIATDIHGSQKMDPNDASDPLTFPLVQPAE